MLDSAIGFMSLTLLLGQLIEAVSRVELQRVPSSFLGVEGVLCP